jgi:hypothetical protein
LLIPDPVPDFYPSRIPDPGVKKSPDPGSGSATLLNIFGPVLKILCKKLMLCLFRFRIPLLSFKHFSTINVLRNVV